MKSLIVLIPVLFLAACSHEPTRGSLEYQDRQVYMCRELCAAGTVEVHRIEGLQCACAPKKEAPIFYNPIVTGSGGQSANPAPFIFQGLSHQPKELTPNANATTVQDASGRTIISQTKE